MDNETKETLAQLYRAAVAAADPHISVRKNLTLEPGELIIGGARHHLSEINNIYVLGAGKAAYKMALAAEEVLGGLITDGAVVTKDGHGGPLKRIRLYEAAHPVPDDRGVHAARGIMGLARAAGPEDLVICLFSGGASSLMALPADGLTLKDKQETTRLLLLSGADIGEVNCVRKHLSAIKGGRLALAAYPARVSTMMLSDVIGNDPGTVASGPTAPDETTFLQAMEILKIRGLFERIPENVRSYLEQGRLGALPETPKPGDSIFGVFGRVDNIIVADNMTALRKAREVAGYMGYNGVIFDVAAHGEAREFARRLARDVLSYREGGALPACLITGGETTVTVKGAGKGGRNTETALAVALEIEGIEGISALFAGTDGTDGPTDAAGAYADGYTAKRGSEKGPIAAEYLANNDSWSFFSSEGGLFVTGPTGTNVMDIGIILVKENFCKPSCKTGVY
ncbi:MAG: glycerate kinase [Nitrospirota bacterium]